MSQDMEQIEKDFLASWDDIEELLQSFSWDEPMSDFISELRSAGYDKLTRAGASMTMLHVSRSRTWRNPRFDPRIVFSVSEDRLRVHYFGRGTEYEGYLVFFDEVKLNNEIVWLLGKLVAKPILD